MCMGSPQQKARRLLRFMRAPRPPRAAPSTPINNRAHLSLDDPFFDATFALSRSRQGAFARHCDGRTGCGVLRVCECTQTPGRRPATPPFRHYERNARMRQCETEGTAHVQRPKVFAKAGPEPTTAAVERREASVADATQGVR